MTMASLASSSILLRVCVCVACILCSADVLAGNRGYVKRNIRRLSRILEIQNPKQRTQRLLAELHKTFDYQTFEDKVLVDAANKLSASERARFSKAFKTMFERKMLSLADDESLNCDTYSVTEGNREADVVVTCEGTKTNESVTLHFQTPKSKKVVDITVGGALLSRNYRGVINKTLRKDGPEALIQKVLAKTKGDIDGKTLF